MLERRDDVIHDLDDASYVPFFDQHSIAFFRGHARFAGERRVELDSGETLALNMRPSTPKVPITRARRTTAVSARIHATSWAAPWPTRPKIADRAKLAGR